MKKLTSNEKTDGSRAGVHAPALAIAGALPLLPRRWRRRVFAALGVKALLCLLALLVALPSPQVLACACSEVVIGSGVVTSSMSVDNQSGYLTLTQSDILLPGLIPVELTRTYQSDFTTLGPFGFGWTVNMLNFSLGTTGGASSPPVAASTSAGGSTPSSGTQSSTSGAGFGATPTGGWSINFKGGVEVFAASSNGTGGQYVNNKGTMKLSFSAPGEVTVLEQATGAQWVFSQQDGTLSKYVDASGNTVNYTWKIITLSGSGGGGLVAQTAATTGGSPAPTTTPAQTVYCPLSVTYPDGRQITFSYDTSGNSQYLCRSATSPSGYTVSYSYTDGLLTGISKSNGQVLSYSYHEVSGTSGIKGWLTGITYANNAAVTIGYNGQYGSTSATNPLRVTSVTGPLGYNHTYGYQSGTNTGLTPSGVKGGATTSASSAPISGSGPSTTVTLTDSLGHSTNYTTSGDQKTSTVVDALGQTTAIYSNAQYLPTNVCSPNDVAAGNTGTHNVFDSQNGDPLAQRDLLSATDELNHQWSYTYDSNYDPLTSQDPLSHTKSYTYDGQRHLLTAANGLNQTLLTNTYNAQGQVATMADGRNNTTGYGYDNQGDLIQVTDALNNTWTKTYDNAGNLLTNFDPYGHGPTMTYNGFYKVATAQDALGDKTTFGYDEMADLTSVQDANGNTTGYTWDELQRQTSVTDALNNTTNFTYDAETNLTTLTDALSHAYGYTFDAVNQTKTFSYPDSTQAKPDQETYGYDADGDLTSLVNRASQHINYAYDAANRLTSKTYAMPGGNSTVFAYSYDNANRMTSILRSLVNSTGANGPTATTQASVSYAFNNANRLTSATDNVSNRTVSYGYDSDQNVNQVTYPGGTVANYGYDARNALSTISDAGGYQLVGYTLDQAKRLVKQSLANGLEADYSYDNANRVTKIVLCQSATPANVVRSFAYGYDAVGNKLWVQYQDGTGDVYQYDATYQVTGVKYGVSNPQAGYAAASNAVRTVTYAYDAVGNRTSVNDSAGASTTYTTNNLNQYTAAGGTNYTYTARGDLKGDGTWTYGYDYEGHLISASKAGTSVTYAYDMKGRRSGKAVNGVAAAQYVYNGNNLIEQRDGSGNVTASYVYAGGIDHPVAVNTGGATYYFQQDALGNVTALTAATGALVEQYSYDVYGAPTIKDGGGNVKNTAMTPFLFTGREYDQETGLYHYRTRAYSPSVGRFLQPDSIRFQGGDINLYRYARNNTISWNDPQGQFVYPPFPVPGGGADNGWQWNPDSNNPRGGTFGPQNPIPGQSQPSTSFEDDPTGDGHWDCDNGDGTRSYYDDDGNPIPSGKQHPGHQPRSKPAPQATPQPCPTPSPNPNGNTDPSTALGIAAITAGIAAGASLAADIAPYLLPALAF